MRVSTQITIPTLTTKPEAYAKGVTKAVAKWAAAVSKEMQEYPMQLSSVSYRRTGCYGSGWRVQKTATTAKVFNDVDYATYVGGDDQVGWAADRGWANINDVAATRKDELVEDIRAAALDALP